MKFLGFFFLNQCGSSYSCITSLDGSTQDTFLHFEGETHQKYLVPLLDVELCVVTHVLQVWIVSVNLLQVNLPVLQVCPWRGPWDHRLSHDLLPHPGSGTGSISVLPNGTTGVKLAGKLETAQDLGVESFARGLGWGRAPCTMKMSLSRKRRLIQHSEEVQAAIVHQFKLW